MTPQSASLLLPLLAPVLYVLILLCVSRITGWHALSRRNPMPSESGPVLGRLWRGSLRFGHFGHYNSSVILSIHEQGLRISAWFHLRIGHAPFFLPWSELRYSKRSRLWILEGLDIHASNGDRLWLPLTQARQLHRLSQGRFWPKLREEGRAPEPAPVSGTQAMHPKD